MFNRKEKKNRRIPDWLRDEIDVLCPKCKDGLIRDGEFLHDGKITIIRCKKCDSISNWLFEMPKPTPIDRFTRGDDTHDV